MYREQTLIFPSRVLQQIEAAFSSFTFIAHFSCISCFFVWGAQKCWFGVSAITKRFKTAAYRRLHYLIANLFLIKDPKHYRKYRSTIHPTKLFKKSDKLFYCLFQGLSCTWRPICRRTNDALQVREVFLGICPVNLKYLSRKNTCGFLFTENATAESLPSSSFVTLSSVFQVLYWSRFAYCRAVYYLS